MPEIDIHVREQLQAAMRDLLLEDFTCSAAIMQEQLLGICPELTQVQVKNMAKKLRKQMNSGLGVSPGPSAANKEASGGQEKTKDPVVEPPLFVTKEVGDIKGLGVFATRDIKKHELILKEKPVLRLPRRVYVDSVAQKSFGQLSRQKQQAVMALHDCHAGEKTLRGIVQTNGFMMGGIKPETEFNGILLEGSRFNHSCVPNVSRGFHEETEEAHFVAVRDVKAGEELCISYLNIASRDGCDGRRAELHQNYKFACMCDLCKLPGDSQKKLQSDRNRREIGKIEAAMADFDTPSNPDVLMGQVARLVELYTAESLCTPQTMGRLADDAVESCAIVGKPRLTTLKYAKMCYENYLLVYGPNGEKTQTAKKWVANCNNDSSYRKFSAEIRSSQGV